MSEEPDLVGTMLGSYRITGELSRGGMGAVYRAVHTVLERQVAVKLLRPELTNNHELTMRLITEAKAASAIRHPGIIDVLDFGYSSDGRAYYVMELLDGESLEHRIEARGRLPDREAAQIARGIASALSAAHDKAIIHRDLKPGNVVLVADPDLGERPKVLDFGIAKLADAITYTQTGALMGTPLYMAPEQARAARTIDHRADLYSLGCVLYEMLVGTPPFTAVGTGEIVAMQLFATPEPPSQRAPGVSPEVERIVLRLLEKEPGDRFADAAEVVAALDVVLGDGRAAEPATRPMATPRVVPTAPMTAHEPRLTSSTREPPPPRSLALVAALAVGCVVTIAIAAALWLRATEPEPPPAPPPAPSAPAVAADPVPPATPPLAPPAPVPDPVLDSTPAPATAPVRPGREKARRPKGSAAKYTRAGSPIEIDLD